MERQPETTNPYFPYISSVALLLGMVVLWTVVGANFRAVPTVVSGFGIYLGLALGFALLSKKGLSHYGFVLRVSPEVRRALLMILPVSAVVGLSAFFSIEPGPAKIPLRVVAMAFWGDSLLTPIAEEAFFRGYLLTNLLDSVPNPRRFLGVSSLSWFVSILFVLMHVFSNDTLPSFIFWNSLRLYFSLVACWAFERTRSLTGPILAHSLYNLGAAMAYLLFNLTR